MNDSDFENRDGDTEKLQVTSGIAQALLPESREDKERWKLILQKRRKLLSKDPTNVQLLNEVGEAAEKIGDLDRALWAYKRAIRITPDYAPTYLHLSHLFQEKHRTDQAKAALKKYHFFAGKDALVGDEVGALIEPARDGLEETQELCAASPACEKLLDQWHGLGISPAEALYLLDAENSDGWDMMRFTLLDLMMRDVMHIDSERAVSRGGYFQSEELLPHERLYANYYARFADSIDLNRLVGSLAIQLNKRFDLYKDNYVRRALFDRGYIQSETQRIWGILPVQRYILSEEGRRAGSRLKRLLKATGAQIDRAIKANPEQAKAFIAQGGPAILLMESHPSGYFQEWLEVLEQIGFGLGSGDGKDQRKSSSGAGLLEEIVKAILSG